MSKQIMATDSKRPLRAWLARHRGAVALSLSLVGFSFAELGHVFHWVPPCASSLLRALFEGALVGSIADWFAVTALFRRVPIPFLARHTNLLAKRRAAMVEGIVDMVQTQWLSPQAVREYLTRISFSQMLAERVLCEQGREQMRFWTRKGLRTVVEHLDHPNAIMLLEHVLQHHLRHLPAPQQVTPFVLRLMRDRALETQLYGKLTSLVETLQQDETLLHAVQHMLLEHIRHSASESRWMRTKLWLGKRFIEGEDDEEKVGYLLKRLLEMLCQQLQAMSADRHHPMRLALRRYLIAAARRYDSRGEEQNELFEHMKSLLFRSWVKEDTARHVLEYAKRTLGGILERNGRWLNTLDAFIYQQVSALLTSSPSRTRLDAFISAQLSDMVDRNPRFVGEIVRESLSTAKLPTQQLIDQIEGKVGHDLQWIRVNGAVVGGIVAVTIAGVRMLWNG